MEAQTENQQTNFKNDQKYNKFACKICLEVAEQPVITPCGHLYCWSCIFTWCKKKQSCPTCNNSIDVNKLTTIYTDGDEQQNKKSENSQQQENTEDIPRRPQNPRNEYNNENNQNNFRNGFNIGFFGFPGMFFGRGFGGGFTFNLGGFQFGAGNQQQQGWQKYIGICFTLFFIFIQFIIPLINYYQDPNYIENETNYKKGRRYYQQRQRQNWDEYQGIQVYSNFEFSEIIAILIILGIYFLINKLIRK